MSNELDPSIDQWYQRSGKAELLRVVAVDRPSDVIEIQTFDGDLEELDFNAWHDMEIELAEEPEDWTGPFDNVEVDDLSASEATIVQQDWRTSVSTAGDEEGVWRSSQSLQQNDEEEDGQPLESYLSEQEPNLKRQQ